MEQISIRSKTPFLQGLLMMIFFMLFRVVYLEAQTGGGSLPINFCGSYRAILPNGNNPDSIIVDRFGNSFDYEDLTMSSQSSTGTCNSGYFSPEYYGNPSQAAQTVICQVLADVSNIVRQRQGTNGCGALPQQTVNIQVAWLSFSTPDPAIVQELNIALPLPGTSAAIGTPFYSNPLDAACHEVALDRPFIKINGGQPSPANVFDGRIIINSDYIWNYNIALQSGQFPNLIDLYSVLIHETMHMMGYASRMGFSDAYSLWDQTLRVVNNYQSGGGGANPQKAIINPSNCVSNCWEKMPGFNNIAINSCSPTNPGGMDVVLSDNAWAPIGGNPAINPITDPDGFNGILSHLSRTCSGQNVNYVMQPGILPNEARRIMTDPEQRIFCALGYSVNSPTVNCNGCCAIANEDNTFNVNLSCCPKVYYSCFGQSIHISEQDLLCNDISSHGDISVARIWPLNPNTIIVQSGDGWDISTQVPQFGTYSFTVNYTLKGCGDECRMHNQRASFVWFIEDCQPCVESDVCENALCVFDFENYNPNPPGQFNYYVWFEHPFIFENNDNIGTPDILNSSNGNNFLNLFNEVPNPNTSTLGREAVTLELQKCIEPNCELVLELDLSTVLGTGALLEVWGSTSPPCSALDLPPVQISNSCGVQTPCLNGSIFDPICITSITATSTGTVINPNLQPAFPPGPYVWPNTSNQNICFLTLVPSGSGGTSIAVDNIIAQPRCESEITCNFTGAKVCADRVVNFPFRICAPEVPTGVDFTLITPSINLPSGWIVVSGLDPFQLTNQECKDIIIQIQVPANAPIGSVNTIVLSGTATGLCNIVEWSCEASVTVEDCGPQGFTCGCIGSNVLNVDCGDPSVDPTDPNTEMTSILDTDIPDHTVNFLIWPNTLFNTCLAVKGNLVIDNNYDLFIFGGEVRMQPGARIIVKSGAKLTLGVINGGTGAEQGIHGCEQMWRSIEVEPGGTLITGYNVIQDGEFAFDIKSTPAAISTFSCAENDFNRNHVGVRVNNAAFASLNQDFGFSKNKFRATSNLLPKFSNDFNNWNLQYPYTGLFVRNTPFFVGANGNAGSDNLFDGLRNGIIADGAALFVYYATIQNLKGTPNIFQPNINDSRRIGIFASRCNKFEVLNSTIREAERGIFAMRSSINFRNNTINPADIGLDFHSPLKQSIAIRDNDIYYRLDGVSVSEAETATLVHIGENDPMVQVPSAIDVLNKTAIAIGGGASINTLNGKIWNNIISIPDYGVGISLGSVGKFNVFNNEIHYNGATDPPGNMVLDGVLSLLSNNNYFYSNLVFGDNEEANLVGFHWFMSEKNRFCCNETNGIAFGFEAEGVCADTKLKYSDIGNHRIGFGIPFGYMDDQTRFGNRWLGTYSGNSAEHLGGVLEVQNSEFRVELPVGTTLWPVMPFSPNAPNQWFLPDLTGKTSGTCSSFGNDCPFPDLPDFSEGYPPRDFTGSELQTASYGFESTPYGAMLQFESGRSLYRKLKEDYGLLGNNAYIDGFYASEGNGTTGVLDEIDSQIAEMWSIDSITQAQIASYRQTLDGIVVEINRIDSLYPFAQTYADTLVLQNHKKVYMASLQQPMVNLQNLTDALTAIQQSKVPSILALNQSLPTSTQLVSNRKTVNQIYLESIASGIFSLDTIQQNNLLSVASQCPKLGGDAVLQARELYNRLVIRTVFNDDILCDFGARGTGSDRANNGRQPKYRASVVPNPSYDHFTLHVSGMPVGTPLTIKITDINGTELNELEAHNGETLFQQYSPGLFFCHVYANGELVDVVKLVVIR